RRRLLDDSRPAMSVCVVSTTCASIRVTPRRFRYPEARRTNNPLARRNAPAATESRRDTKSIGGNQMDLQFKGRKLLTSQDRPDEPKTHKGRFSAIKGGLLIDGNGGTPVKNVVVVLEDKRIREVGPAAKVAVPKGAEVIDCSGYTLMPGLMDLH